MKRTTILWCTAITTAAVVFTACDTSAPTAPRDTSMANATTLTNPVQLATVRRVDLAILGAMSKSFNCTGALAALDGVSEASIAILDKTFGTGTACLTAFLRDRRVQRMEIHLINETCMRSGRTCQPHEFMRGYPNLAQYNAALERRDATVLRAVDTEFRDAATRLGPILRAAGKTCYISPALESNVSPRAGAALLNLAAKHFPYCTLVWNPVGTRELLPVSGRPILPEDGYTGRPLVAHERHNPGVTLGAPCLYSNDGEVVSATNFGSKIAAYRHCRAQFYWTPSFNCIAPGTGFIPPQDRTACTTPDDMRKIVAALVRARG